MDLINNIIPNYYQSKSLSSYFINKIPFFLLILLAVFLLSSCGGGGSDTQNDPVNTSISGYVIDGPISGSSVTLHRINTDGTTGEQVAGPFTTDENGQWSGTLPNNITSMLVVVAKGGQYTDDATGETVTLAAEEMLNSWFDANSPDTSGVVSPITDSLWQVAQQEMMAGESLDNSIAAVEQLATDFWGLDPTNTVPDVDSDTAADQRYGAMLGGFSFLISDRAELQQEPFVSMNHFALTRLLMDDMADGRMDGYAIDGTRLTAPDGTVLPALSVNDLSAFFTEVNQYADSLQIAPIDPDDFPAYIYLGSRCPIDGFYFYGQGTEEQNLAGYNNVFPTSTGNFGRNVVNVSVRNIQVSRSNFTHPQTGEEGYSDHYEITFDDPGLNLNSNPGVWLNGNVLRFTSSGYASTGTSIGDMELEQPSGSIFNTSANSADAVHITTNGSLVFNSGSIITLPDVNGFNRPHYANACGTFNVGAGGSPIYEYAGENHQDQYFVATNVQGLSGTVTLQNNASNNLIISQNGSSYFSTPLSDGAFYNVSISAQPDGQTCSLTGSAGQITGSNVTSVGLSCIDDVVPLYDIGGTVNGLNGSLVLQNNLSNNLTILNDGSFVFSGKLASSESYSIGILSAPETQSCILSNATGTVSSDDITSVQISCSDLPTYTIGGNVTGLNGILILQNNLAGNLEIAGNGSFAFTSTLLSSENYSVTILSAPSTQSCELTNETGTVNSADITTIQISCSDLPTYTIGGSVTGLNGTLVLRNNGSDDLTITSDNTFSFNTAFQSGLAYSVTILSSPTTQNCSMTGASGTVTSANVTDVQVTCVASSELSNLSISEGLLSPGFTQGQTNYDISVSNSISSMTLTPTAFDSNASILVDGSVVPSGDTSVPVNLEVGANEIVIQVTAVGDVSMTSYTLTVTRDAPLSTNDSLSGLSLSTGSISPSFNSLTLAYTASVDFTTSSTVITPTATDGGATITVAGNITTSGSSSSPVNLLEGENIININVLAEDGVTTQSYVITVTRQAAAIFAQKAYIKASNPDTGDSFGSAVAMDGNTIVVGAMHEGSNSTVINAGETDNSLTNAGAVYVFIKTNGVWSQQAYLKPDDMADQDWFGNAVDISGDTIAVGAFWSDKAGSSGTNDTTGAAYVFTRTAGVWTQQQKLIPVYRINNTGGDYFGGSVSLEGDTLAIGASGDDNASADRVGLINQSSGAVYVFKRNTGVWSLEQFLKASYIKNFVHFGGTVSLSGESLAVGAAGDMNGASGINPPIEGAAWQSGAVYVFTRLNNSWTQQVYIKPQDSGTTPYDGLYARQNYFGASISLNGDMLAVGSPGQDRNTNGVDDGLSDDSGAVYMFTRSGVEWTQELTLKASNLEATDRFGSSVAIDTNTLAVSATVEHSSATGIDGDESNNDQYGAGAVYLFTQSNDVWTQTHYVKPSNTPMVENFGAVALDSGTLIVGVKAEDNNTSGINSVEQNGEQGELVSSGAIYTYSE